MITFYLCFQYLRSSTADLANITVMNLLLPRWISLPGWTRFIVLIIVAVVLVVSPFLPWGSLLLKVRRSSIINGGIVALCLLVATGWAGPIWWGSVGACVLVIIRASLSFVRVGDISCHRGARFWRGGSRHLVARIWRRRIARIHRFCSRGTVAVRLSCPSMLVVVAARFRSIVCGRNLRIIAAIVRTWTRVGTCRICLITLRCRILYPCCVSVRTAR